MSSEYELLRQVRFFNEQRGWRKKHTPLQLAISISLEAAELLECFQWLADETTNDRLAHDAKFRERVNDEVADIAIYLLSFCDAAGVDLRAVVESKIGKNEKRFPTKSEGRQAHE